MNTRNGKIARLPCFVRDELNERLKHSEESPQLLAWLNALPEVKKVIRDNFAGAPISKQNLSEWRQGGFQEWLARLDLCEEAGEMARLGEEMDERAAGVLADAAATVLATRLASLIANWNGEADEAFQAKARILNGLCRSVTQLQQGMHRANRAQFELQRRLEKMERRKKEKLKQKLLAPVTDALRANSMANAFGGGTAGEKIAEYVMAVQNDKFDAKLDLLPTDKFKEPEPEPGQGESNPVKPVEVEKTEPEKLGKPLEGNEMDDATEEESSSSQSGSVKGRSSAVAAKTDQTDSD
jgi:uncharacterized protein YukE